MKIKRFGSVLGLAGVLVLPSAAATTTASPGTCALPAAEHHPLLGRQERLAQYEQLPEACLKAVVEACSAAASEALLDTGSAATCSISYEALLKRGFGGDFQAMLAWWRSRQSTPQLN